MMPVLGERAPLLVVESNAAGVHSWPPRHTRLAQPRAFRMAAPVGPPGFEPGINGLLIRSSNHLVDRW